MVSLPCAFPRYVPVARPRSGLLGTAVGSLSGKQVLIRRAKGADLLRRKYSFPLTTPGNQHFLSE